jgi:hypothetical protein
MLSFICSNCGVRFYFFCVQIEAFDYLSSFPLCTGFGRSHVMWQCINCIRHCKMFCHINLFMVCFRTKILITQSTMFCNNVLCKILNFQGFQTWIYFIILLMVEILDHSDKTLPLPDRCSKLSLIKNSIRSGTNSRQNMCSSVSVNCWQNMNLLPLIFLYPLLLIYHLLSLCPFFSPPPLFFYVVGLKLSKTVMCMNKFEKATFALGVSDCVPYCTIWTDFDVINGNKIITILYKL